MYTKLNLQKFRKIENGNNNNINNNNNNNNNRKQSIEKASLRRKFPNLKTKPAFPLFVPYILIKLVYVANVVFHFYLLSEIFSIDYFRFGINLLKNLVQNKFGLINEYFPKRTLCDLELFAKLSVSDYTIHCSLPINLFNEIFYFGFWYWLIFVCFITLTSIFYWLLMFVNLIIIK